MPLMMNWGACYHMNNKVNVSKRLTLKDDWITTTKIEIPAGDGFKLVYSDKYDLKKVMAPKDFWYKAGVAVEFKI